MRPIFGILLAAGLTAGVAVAQDAPTPVPAAAAAPADGAAPAADEAADPLAPAQPGRGGRGGRGKGGPHDSIVSAIRLPLAANAMRQAGYEDAEVKKALTAMHSKGVPADQADELLQRTAELASNGGKSVAGFGAFIERELAAGKRGRELGVAIKDAAGQPAGADAHAGKGKGKGMGRAGKGGGKAGKAGKGRGGKGAKGGRKGGKGGK